MSINLRSIAVSITAGQTLTYVMSGTAFRLLDASAPVTLDFYLRGQRLGTVEDVLAGLSVRDQAFDQVQIRSNTTQEIRFVIADAAVDYDRGAATVTIQGATVVTDLTPATVGTSATLLVSADSGRDSVRFYNAGTADVYLGGSGVSTANGAVRVGPGETWIETNAPGAAWYGVAGTAGQSVRIQAAS